MASADRVTRRVIDAHSHIGELAAWKFYNLPTPVKPTVYDFAGPDDYLKNHLDLRGLERGLVLPNYGIPVQEQPFSLNDLVLDAVARDDRLSGGLWVSFLPANRELTMRALAKAGEARIVALKTTFLLGATRTRRPGTPTRGRSRRPASRPRSSTTSCSTSTPARAAPPTSTTSSR